MECALQSQPCFHRDAEIQSITQTQAAQDDCQAQPGHQLKCPTQTSPVSNCIQFKRQAERISIISIFPLFSSFFPATVQLHSFTLTFLKVMQQFLQMVPGSWKSTFSKIPVICRSYFENLLVQMPRTTWQGLTDIIRELDCFKGHYPRKLVCCCGSWNKFTMGLVAEVLQGF